MTDGTFSDFHYYDEFGNELPQNAHDLREQVRDLLTKSPFFHAMQPGLLKALEAPRWSPETVTFARLAMMLQAAYEAQTAALVQRNELSTNWGGYPYSHPLIMDGSYLPLNEPEVPGE